MSQQFSCQLLHVLAQESLKIVPTIFVFDEQDWLQFSNCTCVIWIPQITSPAWMLTPSKMANFEQFEISKIDIKQTSVLEISNQRFHCLTDNILLYVVYSVQYKFNKSPTPPLPNPLLNSSHMTEHTWGSYPFLNKNSMTLQWLSRVHLTFLKDSIRHKKEAWVYVFVSYSTIWAILYWRSCSFSFGLDKVSTGIQGFSSNNCNLFSRTFKVRANPAYSCILHFKCMRAWQWIMEYLCLSEDSAHSEERAFVLIQVFRISFLR